MKIVYQFSQDFQTNYFAISHWTLYCSSLVTPKYLLNNLKKGDKTFAFLKDIHYDPKTKKVNLQVGVHINNKGEFLPREYNTSLPNSAYDQKYINQQYYKLKGTNNAVFNLLVQTKKEFLKIGKIQNNNENCLNLI